MTARPAVTTTRPTRQFARGNLVTLVDPNRDESKSGVLLDWSLATSIAHENVYGTYTLLVDGEKHRSEGRLVTPSHSDLTTSPGLAPCRHCKRSIVALDDGTWGDVSDPQSLICRYAIASTHAPVTDTAPETGECGECDRPEQFEWDYTVWVNDAPAIVCKTHRGLAPGWAYHRDDIYLAPTP